MLDEVKDDLIEEQKAQDEEDKAALAAEEAAQKANQEGEDDAKAQQEAEQQASEQEAGKSQESQEGKDDSDKAQAGLLAELKRERAARQQAQSQLAEHSARQDKLQERLEHISQALQPQSQAPDIGEHPVEHLAHGQSQTHDRLGKIEERLDKREQETEQVNRWNQFQNFLSTDEQSFKRTNPERDYDAAVDFLRASRDKEYEVMGIYDPATRQQYINQDAVAIAQSAIQAGKSPAEAVWDLASARGFENKPPEGGAQQQNGASQQSGADKLSALAKGQGASKSLSSAGGATEIPLTLEALAEMSDDEFNRIPDSAWRQIMGAE